MCRYSLIPICDIAKKYLQQKNFFKIMNRPLFKLLSIIKAIASICFSIKYTQYVYKSICLQNASISNISNIYSYIRKCNYKTNNNSQNYNIGSLQSIVISIAVILFL